MLDLMIAAALAQAAPGPHWRFMHRGGDLEVQADPASVRRDGRSFEIRLRVVFATASPDGMTNAVVRYRFDCAARTAVMLHSTHYTTDGRQLFDGATPVAEQRPDPVRPTSGYHAVLTQFCPAR